MKNFNPLRRERSDMIFKMKSKLKEVKLKLAQIIMLLLYWVIDDY